MKEQPLFLFYHRDTPSYGVIIGHNVGDCQLGAGGDEALARIGFCQYDSDIRLVASRDQRVGQ